jgi:hypothetical protein
VAPSSMSPDSMSSGTVLGGRYRLEDLLTEHAGARFWRATDLVLARSVGIHAVASSDPRAGAILDAAKMSARVTDPHFLRVLDCDDTGGLTWVVNEWGTGVSLDVMVEQGPLPATRAAWLTREVAEAIAAAHAKGLCHGRLNPENVMVTEGGAVKVIGFVVYAVFAGPRAVDPAYGSVSDTDADVIDLAGILYTALTGRWPGVTASAVPRAPREGRRPLRPRQVRAGVPRTLDAICDRVLNKEAAQHVLPVETAYEIAAVLSDYVGDPATTPALMVDAPEESTEPGTAPVTDEEPAADPATEATGDGPDPLVDPEATMAAAPPLDDTMPRAFAGVPFTELARPDDWEPAPPPPPFDQPPERPLFADTERRVPADALAGSTEVTPAAGAWPFGEDEAGSGPLGQPPSRVRPPGWRRRITLGVLIALLLVAMYVAFNLGRDDKPGTSSAGNTPPASSTTLPTGPALKIFAVSDFDPEGDPPRENPEQAGNAVDGDPATGWQTSRYTRDARLGGLKSGVGLRLDLGSEQSVASIQIGLAGAPTSLEVYATPTGVDQAPTELADARRIGALTANGTSAVARFSPAVRTRYLIVWLTKLPAVAGGFRGEITELTVRS